MKTDIKPLVSIKCLVYNQESYLRQCLDGFIMQKTNFAFEAIVHDDASTDNSAAIIREYAEKYPNIIKPIYETENQYSKKDGSLKRIMFSAVHPDAKYIATCEGDDYWIDPYKLQKQVDFLENNPDYGLVHTYFNFVDSNNNIIPPPNLFYADLNNRIFDGYIWDYYLQNPGFILTCTCMYRKSLYKISEETFFDHGVFMMLSRQSKVFCLREVTSHYRRNPNGAMCSSQQYYTRLLKTILIYQIYYYLFGDLSHQYYKQNLTHKKVIKVLAQYIYHYKELNSNEKKIINKIVSKKPYLFIDLFYSSLNILYQKIKFYLGN